MTVMEGDDRVEIELTPNSPRAERRPSRPPSNPPGVSEPPADPPRSSWSSWLSTPAGRTTLVAVAVGCGALALGWTVGRATDGNPHEASPTPATSAPARSTTPPGDTVPTLPPVTEPRSGRPMLPTTTLAPIATSTVDVAPTLAGAPYDLVGLDRTGELVVLNLTTGQMVVRRDLSITGSGGPETIWAGPGWALVPNWNSGNLLLVPDEADPERIVLQPWQILESDVSGQFWVVDDLVMSGRSGTARLTNRFGERSRTRIDLTEPPRFSDPLGGLVVTAAGSTYRVDTNGVTKIADGEVLALDAERAFSRQCDDQLVCKYVVVDRATGEARDTPFDGSVRYSTSLWPSSDSARIAPGGRFVAASWLDPDDYSEVLVLLDLDTGELTELSRAGYNTIRWSPDGRFAFYLDAGLPMAYELATGEKLSIASDLPRLDALAVRPAGE